MHSSSYDEILDLLRTKSLDGENQPSVADLIERLFSDWTAETMQRQVDRNNQIRTMEIMRKRAGFDVASDIGPIEIVDRLMNRLRAA